MWSCGFVVVSHNASVLASYLWSCLVRLLSLWQNTCANYFREERLIWPRVLDISLLDRERMVEQCGLPFTEARKQGEACLSSFIHLDSSLLDNVTHKTTSHLFSLSTSLEMYVQTHSSVYQQCKDTTKPSHYLHKTADVGSSPPLTENAESQLRTSARDISIQTLPSRAQHFGVVLLSMMRESWMISGVSPISGNADALT